MGWSEEAALGGDIEQRCKGGEEGVVRSPGDVLVNIKKNSEAPHLFAGMYSSFRDLVLITALELRLATDLALHKAPFLAIMNIKMACFPGSSMATH